MNLNVYAHIFALELNFFRARIGMINLYSAEVDGK